MQTHVTCGRGTEVFVKAELVNKLKCLEMSVEDGKVFFTMADPDPTADGQHENIFSMKTAERIFVTVTHFHTCEIKGNGKIKFLQALKDRILNRSNLGKAVKDAQQLQSAQRLTQEHSSCKYDQRKDAKPTFEGPMQASPQLPGCPSGLGQFVHSHTSQTETLSRKDTQCCGQQCDAQTMPPVSKLRELDQTSSNPVRRNKRGELHEDACPGGLPAHSLDHVHEGVTVDEDYPQACSLGEPPEKRQKLDDTSAKNSMSMKVPMKKTESVSGKQRGGSDSVMSFRFSVKCGGWCRKWLKPQRLAKELGIRLSIMMGWTVDLSTPDVEICVHINDDFVTAGIPLTRVPLSKRDYLLDAGLRSTVSWIMASLANIQPGHHVLDPMCGKATILIEAARERAQDAELMGCDWDGHQLQAAARNVKFAQLCHCVHLIQADALNMPLKSASVDRIVCDAPFGQKFAVASCSLPQFYKKLMQEMYRLLTPGGIAVLLTSQELLPVVEENVQKVSHFAEPAPPPPPSKPQVQLHSALLGEVETNSTRNLPQDTCDLVSAELTGQAKILVTVGGPSEVTIGSSVADTVPPVEDPLDRSSPEETALTSTAPCRKAPSVLEGKETRVCSPVTSHAPSTLRSSLEVEVTQQTVTESKTNSLANSSIPVPKSVQASAHINTETMKAVNSNSGLFSIVSSHYVKLGETHAYIVVLQKPEQEGDVKCASL